MTDILIRDVPEAVLAALDAKAKRAGLSRTEYLRRTLVRESAVEQVEQQVHLEDLRRLGALCADVADPEVMRAAWS